MSAPAARIAESFNAAVAHYDRDRRILIPCFDDFYDAALAALDGVLRPGSRVLDLGAGTGLMSALVRDRFHAVNFVLVDIADALLARARERFGDSGAEFRVADYTKADLGGPYDAIISGLSIHHLSDEDKRALYARAFAALKQGGVFVNADQVLGATPSLEARYRAQWLDAIRAKGATPEMIASAQERMKLDRMAPLRPQLDWLGEVGFSDVDCVYKNFSFAVMAGRKAA